MGWPCYYGPRGGRGILSPQPNFPAHDMQVFATCRELNVPAALLPSVFSFLSFRSCIPHGTRVSVTYANISNSKYAV